MERHHYPSDLTEAQWALIEPHIPAAPQGGRPRKTDMRDVVDAILCILRTGCQWRYLPGDLPPRSTVWRYFDRWRSDGTLDTIHDRFDKGQGLGALAKQLGEGSVTGQVQVLQNNLQKLFGDTAILLTEIDLVAVVGGNEVVNAFMVTEVYIKDNATWKMGSLSFSTQRRPARLKLDAEVEPQK